MLSIIIPALDAETTLATTLETCVMAPAPREIIVSYGKSIDATRKIALSFCSRIVSSDSGRGTQLRAGAKIATGDWLMFIHADTQLSNGWQACITSFIADPANINRVGVFNLKFDDPSPAARRIETLANWRTRTFGLPYGDQGLLISRKNYEVINGFQPLPLMEDINLIRRVGRGKITILNAYAVTSSIRYKRDGYWLRPLKNLFLLCLYFMRVSPNLLAKVYK